MGPPSGNTPQRSCDPSADDSWQLVWYAGIFQSKTPRKGFPGFTVILAEDMRTSGDAMRYRISTCVYRGCDYFEGYVCVLVMVRRLCPVAKHYLRLASSILWDPSSPSAHLSTLSPTPSPPKQTRSTRASMDSKRPSLSSPLYLRVFSVYLRVFGFTGPVTQSPSTITEARFPTQLLPEPRTPDNRVFSSIWDHPSALDPIQPTASSSTMTMALPSTSSTSSSLLPNSPDNMRRYIIPASALDVRGFASASSSRTPGGKGKKIHRPPNAFMSFRSWLVRSGKLPPGLEKCQQSVSKVAGKAWKLLDERSKGMWRDVASQLLEDHKKNHPSPKLESSSKNCRTVYEKIRKVAKASDHDTARRLKALADVYATNPRARNLATPRRPRHEPASSHRFPTTPRTPQEPSRGYETPVTIDSQLGSPSTSPSRTFPSPSSTRSFSQTAAFLGNYAPVNPLSSPPGRYRFDDTGIIPQVVDTNEMRFGATVNDAAVMLGLNELSLPHVHYNHGLGAGGNDSLVHHEPTETRTALPGTLTPHQQEAFDAVLRDPQFPLTWDNLAPEDEAVTGSPFFAPPSSLYPFSADFAPPKEVSFANPPTNQTGIFPWSPYPDRWV